MTQDQPLDLAVIGNCRIASLVNPLGRLVWWCFPRFDSDPVFCRLLADEEETSVGEASDYVTVAEPVARVRKAATQLASKMRFVSAQLLALLTDDLWHATAQHANDAADHLADRLRSELGIEPVYPVEANAVFVPVPPERVTAATEQLPVLAWDRRAGVLRAVCSFDTTEEDVTALVAGLGRVLAES